MASWVRRVLGIAKREADRTSPSSEKPPVRSLFDHVPATVLSAPVPHEPTPVVAAESVNTAPPPFQVQEPPVPDVAPIVQQPHQDLPARVTEPQSPVAVVRTRPKVVFIGHSHLGCTAEAFNKIRDDESRPFDLVALQLLRTEIPYMVQEGGRTIYNRVLDPEVEALLAQEKPDFIVLMLEGQQAAAQGFRTPLRPYDFCTPDREFVRAMHGDYVPYRLMLSTVARRFLHIDDFISRIEGNFTSPVIAIGPPPVSGDNGRIIAVLRNNEAMRDSIQQHGVPDAQWRWKTWYVHVAAMKDMYGRHGIPFYPPPPEAFQDDQFIDPKLISDEFHGNARYGALVLRQVQHIISSMQEACSRG